jgi:hypothetical protein
VCPCFASFYDSISLPSLRSSQAMSSLQNSPASRRGREKRAPAAAGVGFRRRASRQSTAASDRPGRGRRGIAMSRFHRPLPLPVAALPVTARLSVGCETPDPSIFWIEVTRTVRTPSFHHRNRVMSSPTLRQSQCGQRRTTYPSK